MDVVSNDFVLRSFSPSLLHCLLPGQHSGNGKQHQPVSVLVSISPFTGGEGGGGPGAVHQVKVSHTTPTLCLQVRSAASAPTLLTIVSGPESCCCYYYDYYYSGLYYNNKSSLSSTLVCHADQDPNEFPIYSRARRGIRHWGCCVVSAKCSWL